MSHGPEWGQREGRKARRFPGLSCQPRPRKTQRHRCGEMGGRGGRKKRTSSPQGALLLPRQTERRKPQSRVFGQNLGLCLGVGEGQPGGT